MDSAHAGHLPWQQSFLEVGPANVEVLAIKRAESGDDSTIIRLQERSGVETGATLRSAALGLDQSVTLRPWEIKTIRVKPQNGAKAEVREVPSTET